MLPVRLQPHLKIGTILNHNRADILTIVTMKIRAARANADKCGGLVLLDRTPLPYRRGALRSLSHQRLGKAIPVMPEPTPDRALLRVLICPVAARPNAKSQPYEHDPRPSDVRSLRPRFTPVPYTQVIPVFPLDLRTVRYSMQAKPKTP
jgi:hypothetical protein